jgi:putative membrane protein
MNKLLLTVGIAALATTQAMAASSPDKTFAKKAAQGGLAEVQVGQLAQQKATSPQVKEFAQTLVNDHMQANQELQQIAQGAGMTLPSEPGNKEQEAMQKLQNLSGPAFDKAFVRDEIKDHQKDIEEFQKEAQSGSDPALKAFAEKTLPVLQKHLQMAQSLNQQ